MRSATSQDQLIGEVVPLPDGRLGKVLTLSEVEDPCPCCWGHYYIDAAVVEPLLLGSPVFVPIMHVEAAVSVPEQYRHLLAVDEWGAYEDAMRPA